MKRAQKKEHLISVATELFNKSGYHAVGIDQIIAKSRIAKTTLYRHFNSKEDLIVAVLQKIDEKYLADMRNWIEKSNRKPEQNLLRTFDFLENVIEKEGFFGCPFISAASEYHDSNNAIFQEATRHKSLVTAYFEELARAAKLKKPDHIAHKIHMLHEGATAVAHITGDANEARIAKHMATDLIKAARRP